jgi:hypothetical protein
MEVQPAQLKGTTSHKRRNHGKMLTKWPAMAFLKPWRHEAYQAGMKLENPSAGHGLRLSWAGVDSSLVKE